MAWPVLTFASAAIGSMASIQAGSFYASLDKPAWAPPGSVFGPVWTILYLMMAVAASGVAKTDPSRAKTFALMFYALQLVANALWSWIFFRWHSGLGAMVDIVVLWGLIAATIYFFWRVRPLYAILLLPYIAWVSFATVLNAVVWLNNPTLL